MLVLNSCSSCLPSKVLGFQVNMSVGPCGGKQWGSVWGLSWMSGQAENVRKAFDSAHCAVGRDGDSKFRLPHTFIYNNPKSQDRQVNNQYLSFFFHVSSPHHLLVFNLYYISSQAASGLRDRDGWEGKRLGQSGCAPSLHCTSALPTRHLKPICCM